VGSWLELRQQVAGSDGRDLDAELVRLADELAAVEVRIAAAMARCRETGAYLDDGFRTVAGWAAATCNWPLDVARQRARLATALPRLPALRSCSMVAPP
jgi:hypothetical protein